MNKNILPLGILLVQILVLCFPSASQVNGQYQGYGNRFQNRNQYYNRGYQQPGFQRNYGATPFAQPRVVAPSKPVDPKKTPTPASIIRYAARPLKGYRPYPRLPGEFEKQKAVLLSVSDLMYQHNGVLTQIVEKTSGRVPLVILYNDGKQLESTVELLRTIKADLSHVSLYQLKLDTIWLRDFGPMIAETGNGGVSTDFYYNGQRPLDDKFPIEWGKRSDTEINRVEWTLQGGNMLSNGKGFSIVTSRIFEDNFIGFPEASKNMDVEFERRKLVVDAFKKDCNINQLLVLEPLTPESTRHVDMFATFLAADHILVAEVDPRRDPVNARILNNNVALLKQIKVDGKPLRVDRIRIPVRQDKYWSPYTNIIFSNNTVLFPSYQSDPPALVQNAIRTYQKLLPGFHVDTVDMTTMQKLEGALHCMSNNIPEFASMPTGILSFEEAQAKVDSRDFVANDSSKDVPKKIVRKQGDQLLSNGLSENPNKAKSNFEVAKKKETKLRTPPIAKQDSQYQAVQTYRRKFIDQSSRFQVDAYAIGFQSTGVVLMRVDNKQEILVDTQRLCEADRIWLTKNERKILANGPKVKRYLLQNNSN